MILNSLSFHSFRKVQVRYVTGPSVSVLAVGVTAGADSLHLWLIHVVLL